MRFMNGSHPPPFAKGETIVNLAAMIGARFGQSSPMAILTSQALTNAIMGSKNIVLLLLDGLGDAQISRLVHDGSLARARVAKLDSVFPSSTAPAVTSLASGLTPASHLITGWHVWSSEHHEVIRPLPLDCRSRPGSVDPQEIFNWRPLAATLGPAMSALQPAAIAKSAFSAYAFGSHGPRAYASLSDLRTKIAETVATSPTGGRYVYAYLPQFDSAAHEHGCESSEAASVARSFDSFYGQIADDLGTSDTLVMAIADHGFIDIPPAAHLRIEDYPEIARHLAHPITGEPRVAFCHVKPRGMRDFANAVQAQLGFAFDCVESEALIEGGWFGPRALVRDGLGARLGHYTLIARDRYCLTQTLAGESPASFKGMHGGVHRDERIVSVSASLGGQPLSTPAVH